MKTCLICKQEKELGEFHRPNVNQCKRCLADRSSKRYYGRYRAERHAASREKSLARKSHVRTVPDLECAYAAGLIDGEGCIRIAVRKLPARQSVGQITLVAHVTNTDLLMIDWLRERWGGRVATTPADPSRNARAYSQWSISANKALHFLDDVYPYLRTKRPQAKIGRRFQRYVQRGGRHRSQRMRDLELRMANEIRRLNWRGLAEPTEDDMHRLP